MNPRSKSILSFALLHTDVENLIGLLTRIDSAPHIIAHNTRENINVLGDAWQVCKIIGDSGGHYKSQDPYIMVNSCINNTPFLMSMSKYEAYEHIIEDYFEDLIRRAEEIKWVGDMDTFKFISSCIVGELRKSGRFEDYLGTEIKDALWQAFKPEDIYYSEINTLIDGTMRALANLKKE